MDEEGVVILDFPEGLAFMVDPDSLVVADAPSDDTQDDITSAEESSKESIIEEPSHINGRCL